MGNYRTEIDKIITEVENVHSRIRNSSDIQKTVNQDSEIARQFKELEMKFSQRDSVVVGWLGMFSSGKSTCINAILHYPLLPTSILPMTGAVTKLVYSQKPYIRLIDKNKEGQEQCVYEFDKPLDKTLFLALKRFFEMCQRNGNDGGVGLSNGRYFTKEGNVSTLDFLDVRQGIMLLNNLFTAYIRQNEEQEKLEKNALELLRTREELLNTYFKKVAKEMNKGKPFKITIGWDSEVLKDGVSFVDLPGLGSTVTDAYQNEKSARIHDEITSESLRECDVIVLTYPGLPMDDFTKKELSAWMENMYLKQEMKGALQIVNLVNKIDKLADVENDLQSILYEILNIMEGFQIKDPPCYGIAALPVSELFYMEEGLIEYEQFTPLVKKTTEALYRYGGKEALKEEILKESRYEPFKAYIQYFGDLCRLASGGNMVASMESFLQNAVDSVRNRIEAYNHTYARMEGIQDKTFRFLREFKRQFTNELEITLGDKEEQFQEDILNYLNHSFGSNEEELKKTAASDYDSMYQQFCDNVDSMPSGATLFDSRKYLKVPGNQERFEGYISDMGNHGLSSFKKEFLNCLKKIQNQVETKTESYSEELLVFLQQLSKDVITKFHDFTAGKLSDNMTDPDLQQFMQEYQAYQADPEAYQGDYRKQFEFLLKMESRLPELFKIENLKKKILDCYNLEHLRQQMNDASLQGIMQANMQSQASARSSKELCQRKCIINQYVDAKLLREIFAKIDCDDEALKAVKNCESIVEAQYMHFMADSINSSADFIKGVAEKIMAGFGTFLKDAEDAFYMDDKEKLLFTQQSLGSIERVSNLYTQSYQDCIRKFRELWELSGIRQKEDKKDTESRQVHSACASILGALPNCRWNPDSGKALIYDYSKVIANLNAKYGKGV